MRKNTDKDKFEKYGVASMRFSQSKRFGVIKFRNIVKNVLSSHVKKVQSQYSDASHWLSTESIPEVNEV